MQQDHPIPVSDKLKTTILAFAGFLAADILLIYASGYIISNIVSHLTTSMKVVMTIMSLANLPTGTVLFAAVVTLAELPSFRLEQTLRGALAGFLGALVPVMLNLVFYPFQEDGVRQSVMPIQLTLIVSAISGVLMALAIDLPRFRLGRVLFFVGSGWLPMGIMRAFAPDPSEMSMN